MSSFLAFPLVDELRSVVSKMLSSHLVAPPHSTINKIPPWLHNEYGILLLLGLIAFFRRSVRLASFGISLQVEYHLFTFVYAGMFLALMCVF